MKIIVDNPQPADIADKKELHLSTSTVHVDVHSESIIIVIDNVRIYAYKKHIAMLHHLLENVK